MTVLKTSCIAALLLLPACATAPGQGPLNANDTLIGRWANGEPGSRCVERFDFKPDGSLLYVSGGGARIEGTFELSARPTGRGLHVLVMKVTRSSGGNDCAGNVREEGEGAISVSYVWIDARKEMLLPCAEDNYDFCDIPLRRVR